MKHLMLVAASLGLASCNGAPLPITNGTGENIVTPAPLAPGDQVYVYSTDHCGPHSTYGLKSATTYTVVTVTPQSGMIEVREGPVGSGLLFTAPMNCFH